jgi:hypothetical protein
MIKGRMLIYWFEMFWQNEKFNFLNRFANRLGDRINTRVTYALEQVK